MAKSLLGKLLSSILICFFVVGSLVIFAPVQKVDAADCDANAVIYCGVTSVDSLKAKYLQNQGGNLQAIYAHFNISGTDSMNGMVAGTVTKSGEVWVMGQKVAAGAVTAGRQYMAGSDKIPGINAYKRQPSVSFRSNSLSALVKIQDGRFQFAVIMSCGNPVVAFPVVKPSAPVPTPPPVTQPLPEHPSLSIIKDVRNAGSTAWQQSIKADPNERIEYRITVTNTGDTDLHNVHIQDSLPDDVSFDDVYLSGSERVNSFLISNLTGSGLVIDSLTKGGSVQIIFAVTIGSQVDACEEPMRNVAFAEADNVPEEQDDALTRVCQPQKPAPVVKATVVKTPPPAPKLPDTGAAGVLGVFSVTTILGFVTYKFKEFYTYFLR